MRTIKKNFLLITMVVTAMILSISCQKEAADETASYQSMLNVLPDGTSTFVDVNLKSGFLTTAPLTADELATLQKMASEEKLARDVYVALYKKWGSQVFQKISVAENTHMTAIVTLLENYGVDVTIGGAGIFADPEVQALYDKLVAAGSVSLVEALKTGALIEELDISDLVDAMEATSNENILLVYENLYRGSRNHLRAFNRELTSLGIVYTPVYLSQEDYNQIVSSVVEKGKQYRVNGQKARGPGQGGKGPVGKGNGTCRL